MSLQQDVITSAIAAWGARIGAESKHAHALKADLIVEADGLRFVLPRDSAYTPREVPAGYGSARAVTFSFAPETFTELLAKQASPQLLFRSGKLTIGGDAEQALLFCSILDL